MFYHELTYWRKAKNAAGCCKATKIFGSAAETADEAANERSKIAANYHPNALITLVTVETERNK